MRNKLPENTYTFIFALIVCVVCSFSLVAVSEGLKSRKQLNIEMDKKMNILKAVDLRDPVAPKTPAKQILEIFDQKIQALVIDKNGQIVPSKKPDEIKEGEELYPLYVYNEGGQPIAYCFPIIGKGLWSTLKGYFALEADAMTVRGITFYEHGETPGLGAEIEKDWFQNNFKGKEIWDIKKNEIHPVAVVKGKVDDRIKDSDEKKFYVDGISGATMTGNGVTRMIQKEVDKYEPFFEKIRKS